MNNEHPRSNAHVSPISRKRKIDTNVPSTSNIFIQNYQPLQPVALNSSTLHPNASAFPTPSMLGASYPHRSQGPSAQPFWANYGHRTILSTKQAMDRPARLEDVSAPIEDALLSKVDIDLSPASKRARLAASLPHRNPLPSKRARLAASLPHRNPLRESRDHLPAPLPTTAACLPRHLKAFARLAPRPRARIIVADVHHMGRIAVHADVFAQIIEAEERVMGPGAARTRRACRRERPRSTSGTNSYRSSIDSNTTHTSNDSISTLSSVLTSDLEDSGVAGPWPDSQYPWSFTALQVEDQRVRARHAELAHVEQWLAAADDEFGENEEPAWNTSASGLEGDLPGLGELPEFSTGPVANSSLSDSVASDEDGADARTALLARASVQDFIARRTARAVIQHTPSGDVVRCICRAGADGRPMIQCSDCRTWAHRICMDAPVAGTHWRCWRCAPIKAAPESVFQPTFVPNSTPSRRIVWQPSPLLPPAPLPETPERTAPFPFHSFITPRFFADFARRDTDDEGDAEMADGSPRRQRMYSPVQSPKRNQLLGDDGSMHMEPSPSTPPPLQSNGTTTPMTPERSAGPRPQPQHSGSTVADSAGPASPTGLVNGLYAGTGACSEPDAFSGEVGVYAGEDSPVRQRRAHRVWQLGTGSNPKAPSDVGVRRGDTVAS
ncbi:unnamed protein product [Rhizoctonia solani]|uniref:Zinc finger PHD-type domain-containing protein n=1 Tax=Rhizoctonia solani TaxID=456999 RepID=A0A8H3ARP2_9AGAM|nr:unnamed protein product [Rhizoctonia solani]